ncbi:hypothetical protein FRC03_001434 [Tulasnella sp. 419]|nr:hypothetical protein FRC03_001434 [Tulasnella sp. 419]
MHVSAPPVFVYPLDDKFLEYFKRLLDKSQRTIFPNIMYMDTTTNELCQFFYPMLDEACEYPVPMNEYNGHRNYYQFENIGCFCGILFGKPKPLKMFQVTKPDSQWLHNWALRCYTAYHLSNIEGPLGLPESDTMDMDYFRVERKDGSEAPVHFYPPIGAKPNLPPRIVFPYPPISFDATQSTPSSPLKTPSKSKVNPTLNAPSDLRTPTYRTTPAKGTTVRPKPRRATANADPEDLFRPRNHRAKIEQLEQEGVLHRDFFNKLTGPLGSQPLGDDNVASSSQSNDSDVAWEIGTTSRYSPYPTSGHVKSKGKTSSIKDVGKGAPVAKHEFLFGYGPGARGNVVTNYHLLLRLLNPASAGISGEEMKSMVWACSSCKGTFIKDIKEDHAVLCKSSRSGEVIVISDTDDEEEVVRKEASHLFD